MELDDILSNLKSDLEGVSTEHALNEVKAKYLGKKGEITALYSKMKDLSNDEKKSFGALINNLKNEVTSLKK